LSELEGLRAKWDEVLEAVDRAAKRSARPVDAVKILPVSKGQSIAALEAALALPRFPPRFGENYFEELEAKAAHFPSSVEWHYQGRLQSRKIPGVLELVTVLQTVARAKEVEVMAKGSRKPGFGFFVQVNVSSEDQKNGCPTSELPLLLERIEALGLSSALKGLMTLPSDLEIVGERRLRQEFSALRDLRDRHLPGGELSMGMSHARRGSARVGSSRSNRETTRAFRSR